MMTVMMIKEEDELIHLLTLNPLRKWIVTADPILHSKCNLESLLVSYQSSSTNRCLLRNLLLLVTRQCNVYET